MITVINSNNLRGDGSEKACKDATRAVWNYVLRGVKEKPIDGLFNGD
jgi:hypothetical protein